MINYSLKCHKNHEFDAWFRSSQDYDKQIRASFISCPICSNTEITKALMAPAIHSSKNQTKKETIDLPSTPIDQSNKNDVSVKVMTVEDQLRSTLRSMRIHIEKNCENVGENFAKEARLIKDGINNKRGIYGKATPEEAEELMDEGIEVAAIPWIKDDS